MTTPALRTGMLERSLALFPGWQLTGQQQRVGLQRRDWLGAIASVESATLGEVELDVLSWLSAQWWEQGSPRDGITRFTWYALAQALWGGAPGWEPGGRERRMVQDAVDSLIAAVVTLSGHDVHSGDATPALFSKVHILRSMVGQRRGRGAHVEGDAAHDGALREDTVEVRLEDWLVAQLLGDEVALLDWQLQRELTGLAKRLWCFLAGRGPDFVAGALPGEEVLTIALDADVYAAWSLHSARERNNRGRVITAADRILQTDPRYMLLVVEVRPGDRRRYQLRAVRRRGDMTSTPASVPAARLALTDGQLELVGTPQARAS